LLSLLALVACGGRAIPPVPPPNPTPPPMEKLGSAPTPPPAPPVDTTPSAPACPDGAFLMHEGLAVTAVEWVTHRGGETHVHSVMNQSLVGDLDVVGGPAETTTRATYRTQVPGEDASGSQQRDYTAGVLFWSDRMPTALEGVLRRARHLGTASTTMAVQGIGDDRPRSIVVERRFSNGYTARLGDRRYDAVTDDDGCLRAAVLPAYGITFERRDDFALASYAPWPRYAAAPDGAYTAADVRIPAPEGHVLAGTLTLPAHASGRLPAIVLISGISKHERNHGQPPLVVFRDIADVLARAGIAALRVDDRGVGASTGDYANATTLTEAKDVHTEIAWLRARKDIDPRRVAVVGYSEGGLIAPVVASEDPTIAAAVLLAGPGVSGPELARYQVEIAVENDATIAAADRERAIAKELAEPMSPRETVFMSLDPLAYAAKVRAPSLILQGGSDRHVPPVSAERLADAMRRGGNANVTVRIFDNLSHMLVPDPEGLASGWKQLPSYRMSDELLHTLTDWLVRQLRPSRSEPHGGAAPVHHDAP
jgi:dienelactone hydrolase